VFVTLTYVGVAFFQLRAISRQADITERALTAIEDAYVRIDFESYVEEGAERPLVKYWFVNQGRTPATLVEWCAMLRFHEELPSRPEYSTKNTLGYPAPSVLIAPNGGETNRSPCLGPVRQSVDGEFDAMWKGQIGLFFYGFQRYECVFGHIHKVGFGYSFAPAYKGFWLAGGKAYNYHRREKTKRKDIDVPEHRYRPSSS
jgi:hypothetical protein